jgi:predicted TIM-barrel fold metal-dependent hydrolase
VLRVIAIEEHFRTEPLRNATLADAFVQEMAAMRFLARRIAKLDDLSAGRLADMDAAGIDMQVLSHTRPATEILDALSAVPLARTTNDLLADAIAAHPDRFAGFATLPTPDPDAAADELERAVTQLGFKGAMINGHTHGRFLDDQSFWPILERAEHVGVPLYIHPTAPPDSVRDAYYQGFSPVVNNFLAGAGWGWHIETGLHALRLILAGVFDRFPRLTVILGHLGEALPFMLDRANMMFAPQLTGLQRSVRDYFIENFYITTSGMFTHAPLLCALSVIGVDRIIFSVDYPYSTNEEGRAFLDTAPVSPTDRDKIAYLNVERLLGL